MINLVKYSSEAEVKAIICEIGRRMYEGGLVVANDGNISIRHGDSIWATATGVSKGYMTPEMMVKLDLEGNVLEGGLKPSSEIKMHLRVYRENPLVRAVMHAHPPVATAFSIAGIPLDKPILAEAIISFGIVPLAPYATPGTQEVPEAIAPYCSDYNAVLLANHGALTWGSNPQEAYFRMESLEQYAKILMYTGHLKGGVNELGTAEVEALNAIRRTLAENNK